MKILILAKTKKVLTKVTLNIQNKIINQIDSLALNPFPKSAKKLTDQPGYRIRVADWRILYIVDIKKQQIYIVKIGHRHDIYR